MARRQRQERRQAKLRKKEDKRERHDRRRHRETRRGQSLTWDIAPLMLLAGAGVALLRDASEDHGHGRRIEPGRGRQARKPTEIPKRGWKDILLRTKAEFTKDQVPLVAAGVTFYTLLALFPGIAAFVGLYGLFADVNDAQRHLALLSVVIPPGALSFIGEQMVRVAEANKGGQSLAFVVGLLVAIWSANGAVKAMMTGLNIAYDEKESRNYIKRTLVSLAFTLGFLVFVIAGIAMLAAQPAIETFAGSQAATLFGWLSWPVLLVSLMVGLALLYRYGPSRDPVRWRWITWGSAAVIIFWAAASALFSVYVANFAHYDKTYGSLGAVIGFMMWIYLSAVVVLAGAELNSEIEHQTAIDTTVGAPRPLGLRRAKMADTVGAAQGA